MARSRAPGLSPEQQVLAAKRVDEALRLREKGLTYQKIGEAQGCGKRTAQRRVERALLRLHQEKAPDVLKLEIERLDRMFEGLANKGAFDGDPRAVMAAVKILERRAKYLDLDAPEKKDVTLKSDATPAKARALMQELFGGNVRAPADGAIPDVEGPPDGDSPPPGASTH